MKANEAPEKIYLQPLEDGKIYNHWYSTNLLSNFIEYTRTDAFIEKAAAWLDENLLNYWQQVNTNAENFIEDFKKAMEESI